MMKLCIQKRIFIMVHDAIRTMLCEYRANCFAVADVGLHERVAFIAKSRDGVRIGGVSQLVDVDRPDTLPHDVAQERRSDEPAPAGDQKRAHV